MRTLLSFIVSLLVVATMAAGQAQGNLIVHFNKTGKDKLISLHLANLKKQFTNISITGMDGRTWYSDYVWNKHGYASNIDLNVMDPGDYILTVANGKEQASKVFFVTSEEVVMANAVTSAPTNTAIFEPTPFSKLIAAFKVEEGRPLVNIQLANLLRQPASVRLATWNGLTVFWEYIDGETGYHKAVSLEGLSEGSYFLYVNSSEAKVFQQLDLVGNTVKLGPMMGKERALIGKYPGVAVW